jgi:hypothetical protein
MRPIRITLISRQAGIRSDSRGVIKDTRHYERTNESVTKDDFQPDLYQQIQTVGRRPNNLSVPLLMTKWERDQFLSVERRSHNPREFYNTIFGAHRSAQGFLDNTTVIACERCDNALPGSKRGLATFDNRLLCHPCITRLQAIPKPHSFHSLAEMLRKQQTEIRWPRPVTTYPTLKAVKTNVNVFRQRLPILLPMKPNVPTKDPPKDLQWTPDVIRTLRRGFDDTGFRKYCADCRYVLCFGRVFDDG